MTQPSTVLYILAECPVKSDYEHTLRWNKSEDQYNYFFSLKAHSLTSLQYKRVGDGVIKVPLSIDQLIGCNYLMFSNQAHEKKVYYAFIKSVEYVGETVSNIVYEIDVMQTWYFDYVLMPCFVEREHSSTDEIGDNILPEKLDLGDYTGNNLNVFNEFRDWSIIIASTHTVEDGKLNTKPGRLYSYIYSGLFYNIFPLTNDGVEAANAFITLDSLLSGGSSIVSVFMMPTAFVDKGDSIAPGLVDKEISKDYSPFDGYAPKNNKLFTYPFNFLYVTNMQGNGVAYKYERFSSDKCEFYLQGDTSCNPGVVLTPCNYNGSLVNYDENIMVTGFPQCAYTNDAFAAYLSQVASGFISRPDGLAGALSNIASSPAIGTACAAVNVASAIGSAYIANYTPDQAKGNSNTATLYAAHSLGLAYCAKRVTGQYAKIIDEYFDKYGYATHRVKVPNIYNRPHWNYVKTVDCYIKVGRISDKDALKIQSIYNNGITFWENGEEVGDYSLDNKPVKKEANNG